MISYLSQRDWVAVSLLWGGTAYLSHFFPLRSFVIAQEIHMGAKKDQAANDRLP